MSWDTGTQQWASRQSRLTASGPRDRTKSDVRKLLFVTCDTPKMAKPPVWQHVSCDDGAQSQQAGVSSMQRGAHQPAINRSRSHCRVKHTRPSFHVHQHFRLSFPRVSYRMFHAVVALLAVESVRLPNRAALVVRLKQDAPVHCALTSSMASFD